jgi:hypothetical protein
VCALRVGAVIEESSGLCLTGVSPSPTTILAMTERLRIRIAALITALFLGALCAAGVLTHTGTPMVSAASSARTAAPTQLVPGVVPSSSDGHDSYD